MLVKNNTKVNAIFVNRYVVIVTQRFMDEKGKLSITTFQSHKKHVHNQQFLQLAQINSGATDAALCCITPTGITWNKPT